MPSRNIIKEYCENGYYHIYNRGVEKRSIFLEEQDHSVFLSYLKEYLLPKDKQTLLTQLSNPKLPSKEKDKILKLLRLNNFADKITLIAYCLMPNHFHFLIKQKGTSSMDKFISSLCTRYTMYFNRKYKRVGTLYQGTYKAVLVTTEEQFLHLTRYIHKQALVLQRETLKDIPCSYPEYLRTRNTVWVKPEEILEYFSSSNSSLSYQLFVESTNQEESAAVILSKITIEDYD